MCRAASHLVSFVAGRPCTICGAIFVPRILIGDPAKICLETKMGLYLKRLSVCEKRLGILSRTKTVLQAQRLELTQLRERWREARRSVDRQKAARARTPATVVIAAVA